MKNEKYKLYISISSIIILLSLIIFGVTFWMVTNFGAMTFEQFYFGITTETEGTPLKFYLQILIYVVILLLTTVIIAGLYYQFLKRIKLKFSIKKIILGVTTLSIFIGSLVYLNIYVKVSDYLFSKNTTFFEDNYVLPSTDIIKFPDKKKNLIFIYLESYESTYLSKELGGNSKHNLLPNITNLVQSDHAINFSNSDKLGGLLQAPETNYSIAGMFAMQSGLPLKVPIAKNEYGKKDNFAPGTITLGDILQKEGYNLEFLVGADGTFAGVNNFYQTHGDWNILDLNSAIKQGFLPEGYMEWWGYEDRKIFEFSKQKLETIAQSDKPFAMIIEADDTHYPHGYTDKACPTNYDEPYANSISCVDSMVNEFIEYVKKQDYYKDTVIVIQGDHLSMEKEYFKSLDDGYDRTTFNAYLNIDSKLIENAKNKNRHMYSMDVFPTTLAAMNVEIKGDRLGLGTNLFSKEATLYEQLGIKEVNKELSSKSEYFYKEFLFSKRKYQ